MKSIFDDCGGDLNKMAEALETRGGATLEQALANFSKQLLKDGLASQDRCYQCYWMPSRKALTI